MKDWKKEQIDTYISELSKYYKDCSPDYFDGANLPNKLNKEELYYLNSNLNLGEIVGAERSQFLIETLKDKSKDKFSLYVIRTQELDYEVNSYDQIKSTVFIELARKYFEAENWFSIHLFINLFNKGYKIKGEDDQFVMDLYKDIGKQSDFDKWAQLRFAVKLNDAKKFEVALYKNRELFTMLSFKMGKPVHFNFPNLLGIAVNAIQHYRESGDLILKAIDVFGQTTKIQKLDMKKGTFKRKRNEYLENRPIQSKEFEEVAEMIFPELN